VIHSPRDNFPKFKELMKPLVFSLLVLLVLSPIVANSLPTNPTGTSHRHGQNTTQSTLPPLLPYVPKYYEHVQPILEKACLGCHVAGEIAPFSLETPEAAVQRARDIQLAVQAKRMPPWLPAENSLKFVGERRLSDEEIAILANWSWAGAPLGKKPATSVPRQAPAPLQPDLLLDTGREFSTRPDLSDEWRCFLLEPKLTRQRFMTAFNIRASNPRLVHHVGLFQVTAGGIAQAKQLEGKSDGRGGYPCLGSAGVESRGIGLIGFWLPGNGAVRFPENTGIRLEPADGLVLQVHYNTLNGQGSDRTRAELVFAPIANPPKQPISLGAFISQPEIPCVGAYPNASTDPCNRDYAYDEQSKLETLTFGEQGKLLAGGLRLGVILQQCGGKLSDYTSGSDGISSASCVQRLIAPENTAQSGKRQLRFVLPHMHFLASQYKLELLRGGNAQTILEIPRWDFHWQNGYFLAEPLVLQAGDQLRHTCVFDNRPENQPFVNGVQRQPQYVVWGERSFDEMCVSVYGTSAR
jgi:hypothetical protein